MGMTPEQARAWELRQQGKSIQQIADIEGVSYNTASCRLRRAKKWAVASDGQAAAMEVTGLQPDVAKFGWRIIQHDDGSKDSVFWDARGQTSEDILEAIHDALSGVPKVKPVRPPTHHDDALLTLYPVADLHAGMMAWGRETGEDYDTAIASERLINWIGQCVSASPKSKTGIILAAGDLLHANDNTNATPQSKHALDVDTRHFKTVSSIIHAMAVSVDLALRHHQSVIVVVKPGNHDRDAYIAVLFGLAERYRNEPRVIVEKDPSEFWAYQFGTCMLAAHHGDKARAQRMVLYLADRFPEMWGRTRHRFLWTGHLHHHKSEDIGGVQWEQLRAITAPDAYAASHAYSARAQMQGITYHREKGEVSRVKVAS